jgi:hypothetical protein
MINGNKQEYKELKIKLLKKNRINWKIWHLFPVF